MKMYCSYCRIASSNSHYKGTQLRVVHRSLHACRSCYLVTVLVGRFQCVMSENLFYVCICIYYGQIGLRLLLAMIVVLAARCVILFLLLIMLGFPSTARIHSICYAWLPATHQQRKHLCRMFPLPRLILTEYYRLTILQ